MKICDLIKKVEYKMAPIGSNKYVEIGDIDISTKKYTLKDKLSVSGAKYVNKGDIIISTVRPTRGAITIINDENLCVSNAFAILSIDESIADSDFIFFLLNTKKFLDYLGTNSKGATYPTCSKDVIFNYEIGNIPLNIQKDFGKLFKFIFNNIELEKRLLNSFDELVKSRFIEMFGNPIINSKQLPELTLPELGHFGRGVSKHRPRNDIKLLGGPYPLIQTGEVANADLYIDSYSSTYSELGLKQSKMWAKGTLCITIASNIAKTGILTFDACFPDSVVGFTANEKSNNIFIHYWFTFLQSILEDQAPASAQKNINLKVLSELKVIVPPIEQQNQFAEFVKQIDKLKFVGYSRYFLCEILTFASSTIAYSRVVSIFE